MANSRHDGLMPKRSGEKRDFMQIGREIVERAIGEHMDGTPLERREDDNVHAAAGRIGGKKGGRARADKLSATERKEIAQRAARARWAKESKK